MFWLLCRRHHLVWQCDVMAVQTVAQPINRLQDCSLLEKWDGAIGLPSIAQTAGNDPNGSYEYPKASFSGNLETVGG